MTAKNKKYAIEHIRALEDEIDEFLTDKFCELEIGLDELNIKEHPFVFSIFDKTSDKAKEIDMGLKKLRRLINTF